MSPLSTNESLIVEKDEQKDDKTKERSSNHRRGKNEKKESYVKEARRMISRLLEEIEKDNADVQVHDSSLAYSKNPLIAFSTSETVSVEKFRNSGGLRSIVVAIKRHQASSGVVDSGCRALQALCLKESSVVKELIRVGAIDSIVSVIQSQSENGTEDASVSAIKTLRNLTQSEDDRAKIFLAKGTEAIIDMMNKKSDSARTLSHSALFLSNLAFGNTERKESVGRLNGLKLIASGMKQHPDFQPMQSRGSLALRNLCFSSEFNQNIAGEHGAIEALLSAIEKYTGDREIVHQSCVALVNLSNLNEDNRLRIVEAGGAHSLVKLLKKYKDSASANDDCISVIRNISVGSPEARLEIGVSGGIECICKAMEKFQSETKLVEKACTALRYLCFLKENREKVAQCHGIEAIVSAIEKNSSSPEAVENALLAIGNATFECEESKSVIGRCGGIEIIIEAIEQHRLRATVQEHGCRVLRNLSDGNEFNRKLQTQGGAINTGVLAMMGYPENASVQEQACAMLLNLSHSPGNIQKLVEAEIGSLAEKAMNQHAKNRGVQLQAGSLLHQLNGFRPGQSSDASVDTDQVSIRKKRSIMRRISKRG